jgi:hypothetical protein
MMDSKVIPRASAFSATHLLAVLVFASSTLAQEAPPQENSPQESPASVSSQPKPAGRDYHPLGDAEDNSQSPSTLSPDTVPLTGVLVPGVGNQELRHSYLVPGFQYGNFIRSASLNRPLKTGSEWNSTNFLVGNLSLLQNWHHSQLTVNYSGGGTFSTDKLQGNGYYHQLGLLQSFNWQRWQLSFIDQFSYLPQAQFGFGASSTLATPGVGGSLGPSLQVLQPNYQPSQSIFSAAGPRYSNSITTQIAYAVSPRGSVTFAGSYDILRFVEAGNIDSNETIFNAGYNYSLSTKDTIGLLYRFSEFRYFGSPQAIEDHVAQAAYGRKVTGRLALQLFVGPDITVFRVHDPGFSDRTSVAGGANLTYSFSRSHVFVSYNHGISGGSGVLTGARADSTQGSVDRQLSRLWHGNISFGYSRNSSLASGSNPSSPATFDSWFTGAGLDRPLGRSANFSIAYSATLQSTSQAGCSVASCSSDLQHQVSLSFQWHSGPLVLR